MSVRKIIVGLIFLTLILGFIFWWVNGSAPENPNDASEKMFVVERGSGLSQIALALRDQGIIKNKTVFQLTARIQGVDKKIRAGDYKLSPSMNVSQILKIMSEAPLEVWITIPEGFRAEEIADTLQANLPSYNESWRAKLVEKEGYLFPDTYLIPRDATIETVLSVFENNFNKKIEEAGLVSRSDLEKIVIIASLIEREAFGSDEMPTISSVIANRLRQGMALDIDATLQYAKGKVGDKWWTVPTAADKNINSPYNTYKNPGLPPGPIGNPGIEAIKAAANPKSTSYFFYLHDSEGNVYFARTLEEHNANVNRYLR